MQRTSEHEQEDERRNYEIFTGHVCTNNYDNIFEIGIVIETYIILNYANEMWGNKKFLKEIMRERERKLRLRIITIYCETRNLNLPS